MFNVAFLVRLLCWKWVALLNCGAGFSARVSGNIGALLEGGVHPNKQAMSATEVLSGDNLAMRGVAPLQVCASGDVRRTASCSSSSPLPSTSIATLATRPFFCDAVAVVLQEGGGVAEQTEDKGPATKRRGLNPYLQFKNRWLAAAKANAGRVLSRAEVTTAEAAARAAWQSLPDTSAHKELYQNWVTTAAVPKSKPAPPPYKPMWGGGCRGSPVSATELRDYFVKNGWPKDSEIHSEKPSFVPPLANGIGFETSAGYDCHGCLRSGLGVCKEVVRQFPNFALAHAGLCNVLDFWPRDQTESGCMLLLVEGRLKASGALRRWPFLVSGTSWSPRVFECARLRFRNPADEHAERVELPCDVSLGRRASVVSDRFQSIDFDLSGRLVLDIVEVCRTAHLFTAEYSVPLDDGTLAWSRITALSCVGELMSPSMKQALYKDELAAKRREARGGSKQAMRSGDPLSAQPLSATSRRRCNRPRRGARADALAPISVAKAGGQPTPEAMALSSADAPMPSHSSTDLNAHAAEALGDSMHELMLGALDLDVADPSGEMPDDSDDSDGAELWATFAGGGATAPEHAGDDPDVLAAPGGSIVDVVRAAEEQAEAVGLGESGDAEPSGHEGGAGSSGDGNNRSADVPFEALLEAVVGPRADPAAQCIGPSADGYVQHQGRTILRIIRGKPRGSLSVRCYLHPSCKFLLPLSRAPADSELLA